MFRRVKKCLAAWLAVGCLLAGCGSRRAPTDRGAERSPGASESRPARQPAARRPKAERNVPPDTGAPPTAAARGPGADEVAAAVQPVAPAPRPTANLPRLRVDDARATAAGIRKLSGQRLTLYTDLPPGEEIDQLPNLFDQAFPQWCKYFDVDAAGHSDWKMTGFLIKDKDAFGRTGLLPEGLPPFQNAFSRNHELWLYDQPSSYYRRHLLLHEGTHGLMNTILGGCGPPWYMEGMAELLATHRWQNGRLTLNYLPAERDEVPYWGRIRIIKDAVAAGRPMHLKDVIAYPIQAHLETEPYAWCWAAAALLDRHPRYRDRFHQLSKLVAKPDFNQRFYALMGDDWEPLCEEWQLLVTNLEYGYDIARTAVDFTPGKPLPPAGASVTVAADRGWQNSGLRLEAGVEYQLRASGRYQVADKPQIWWCEPGGVSIRYYQGRPLGILLAAVRADPGLHAHASVGMPPSSAPRSDGHASVGMPPSSALLRPTVVGLEATLTPNDTGTLYLKTNDSPAELDDNAGQLKVEITRR